MTHSWRAVSLLEQPGRAPAKPLRAARHKTRQPNAPAFDARGVLYAVLGVDLTQIHGLGPYLALKLISECGTDLSAWPSAKHFTSWLSLALVTKSPEARSCRRGHGHPEIVPPRC